MNAKPSSPHRDKGDLTNGSVLNHLLRLSIPMIWGIAAIISFQLVDTYFISLLGTEALAAVSYTFPVGYFIFCITLGFSIAMSSVLSRLIGAGNIETGRRVVTHGLMLVFGIGVAIALIGIAIHDSVFRAMGADDEMLVLIREYMIPSFAGSAFVTLPLVGNAAIRASGDSVSPALIMTFVALLNLILDPLLIFGLYGFPRLELFGAAIATVIANVFAALAGLYLIYFHKKLICRISLIRFDLFWDSVKRLLFIALPAGLTNAILPVVNAVIISLIAVHGNEAVAAYGIVNRVEAFSFIVLMALSTGMVPIIGQNWGAEKFARVRETLRLTIGFNVLWSLIIAVLLYAFGYTIASTFSNNEAVIETTVLFFTIVPLSYAFGNLINGWSSAFNAIGKPQRSVIMTVVRMIVLLLPAVYIGDMISGVYGIFIAIAVVNVVSGLGFHIWCRISCRQDEQACAEHTA